MLDNIGLNGLSVLRSFFKHRHITDSRHRHVERSRNRGCRQGQHIDSGEKRFEFFFLSNSEPLLLVNDDKTEITELDIL